MKSARTVISDRLSLYSAGPGFAGSGVRPLRKRFDPNEPITPTENDTNTILPCEPLHVEDGHLVDALGRKRVLKGINVDSAMKFPTKPSMPSYEGNSLDPDSVFFDGDNVSFVGRPFPLEEAELHLNRIKSWGFNVIRYLLTWEAIEHAGPGKYDDDFVNYTIELLKIIHKVGGLYVFMECHQDVWSRYSGGSGAPLWTFYAAGLEPKNFSATEAAILQNDERFERAYDQECYPKMLWTTNYKRLASFTMFTLFFAGSTYFPHLKINGVNIQTFLQKSHLKAMGYLWRKVTDAVPEMLEDNTLLGFESINEPNCGLVGQAHMGHLPGNQHLRLDTTPTVYQCFRLGMGLPVEVDVYKITVSGPQKDGSRMVDPHGVRAWLLADDLKKVDAHYNWRRSGWKGECIFAGLKIWKWNKFADWDKVNLMSLERRLEFSYQECQLVVPNYFNQVSPRISFNVIDDKLPNQIDLHFFINHFFVEYYRRFKKTIRSITPGVFMLIEPPVLEPPPALKDDERGLIDDRTIYCPHYYDGLSLLMKTWNDKYNVDTLGIMRGRYLNPVLGLVVGERAIRNCIKKQFCEIVSEARDLLGNVPVLMSETGMPFDMDGKRAYEDGRYTSQTAAIDALANALEGLRMHHTYWCYTSINCHKWGDRWNNEDFSFWSPEDRDLAFDDDEDVDTSSPSRRSSVTPSLRAIRALKETAGSSSIIKTRLNYHKKRLMPNMFKKQFCCDEDTLDDEYEPSFDNSTLISVSSDNLRYKHMKNCYPSPDGLRAPSAVLRPFLMSSVGVVKDTEFDIKAAKFALTLTIKEELDEETLEKCPTVIFVPKWHFPFLNYNDIYLTSGHVKYNEKLEYLEWYHFDTDDTANGSSTSSMARAPTDDETIIIKNHSGKYEDISQKDENLFGDVCSIV